MDLVWQTLLLAHGVGVVELWLSKLLDMMAVLTALVCCMLLPLFYPLRVNSLVLSHTRVYVVLAWLLFYSLHITLFICSYSYFSSNVEMSRAVCSLLWLGSNLLEVTLRLVVDVPKYLRMFGAMFPGLSLLYGLEIIFQFDFNRQPLAMTSAPRGSHTQLTMLEVVAMQAAAILLSLLLILYLGHVLPLTSVLRKPFCFCFLPSFWRRSRLPEEFLPPTPNEAPQADFEPVVPGLAVAVSLRHVRKLYSSGHEVVMAVDDVHLDLYQGEITTLLGHNGAGKTTTMAIITGMTRATSGQVLVDGHDIAVAPLKVCASLGVCSQQDILYRNLTALQMVVFIGRIKGMSHDLAVQEATKLLERLKMLRLRFLLCNTLSQGEKRKLSLATALIGDSRVLILDEPTSRMDPALQREVWELLLGLRGKRTILLTTHSMDEADIVSDRIAIVDHGRVRCYGSPVFLKTRFGTGYTLTLVLTSRGAVKQASAFVREFVPSANLSDSNGMTLRFQLPESDVTKFPALFDALDSDRHLTTYYSLSLSTVEDVLLKVRRGDTEPEVEAPTPLDSTAPGGMEWRRVRGPALYMLQTKALLIKKYIVLRRSPITIIMLLVIFVCVLFYVLLFMPAWLATPGVKDPLLPRRRYTELRYTADRMSGALGEAFQRLVQQSGGNALQVAHGPSVEFSGGTRAAVPYDTGTAHDTFAAVSLVNNAALGAVRMAASINTSIAQQLHLRGEETGNWRDCQAAEMPLWPGLMTVLFSLAVADEMEWGAKSLQLMVTPRLIYWSTTLIVDLSIYIMFILPVYLVYATLPGSSEVMLDSFVILFPGVVLWCIGTLLVAYLIVSIFTSAIFVFYSWLIVFILYRNLRYWYPDLPQSWYYRSFLYIHPTPILQEGFTKFCENKNYNHIYSLLVYDLVVLLLLVNHVLPSLLLWLLTSCCTCGYLKGDPTDVAVAQEMEAARRDCGARPLVALGLRKTFLQSDGHCMHAVREVSFRVKEGECFGLLGVNGAGKSTTFNMLTGQTAITRGKAYVYKTRLSFWNRHGYLFNIGYCPQGLGFLPDLEGREMLRLFARLRGVHHSMLESAVDWWIAVLELKEHADKLCWKYSGGTMRKMKTGVAMIGDPRVLLLDEPTSGVDPGAKRRIWGAMSNCKAMGQSLVLSTHSMEECESLCSRLTIMAEGRLRCIGETVELKQRYGQGFSVHIKMSPLATVEEINQTKKKIAVWQGWMLTNERWIILRYRILSPAMTWSKLFQMLEDLKEGDKNVVSYAAKGTSLEQLFFEFAATC